jgi:hypothetical protein
VNIGGVENGAVLRGDLTTAGVPFWFRDTKLRVICSESLEYKELTAA